jgi:hypothetical protein
MGRRAALRLFALLAPTALAVAACLSPTLPLPPPDVPDTIRPAQGREGVWQVSGACTPGARVTVIDEATGLGAVFEDRRETGRYAVELEGARCDVATVEQDLDDDESASAATRFVLQETTKGVPDDPSACR